MTVQDIIDMVVETTRDIDKVSWTDADIIEYVNEAVKVIVQVRPEASSKKDNISSVAGVSQTLPSDAVSLINVLANSDGTVINEVDVTMKDAFSPGWRNTTAAAIVKEFFRRSAPTEFEVWPPLNGIVNLLVEYSYYPADVTAVGDIIGIHNSFQTQLRNYCLYKTFARDSENTPSVHRAAIYLKEFRSML